MPSVSTGIDLDEDEGLFGPILAGTSPVAPGGFSGPGEIPGLYWFFNPDTGLFQTAGGAAATALNDPVGQAQDQSASLSHAAQLTAANRPLLKPATQNSKNTILWDGSNDAMEAPLIAHAVGTADFWWIVCVRPGATGPYRLLVSNTQFDPGFYIDALQLRMFWNPTTYAFNTTLVAGTFYIVELKRTSGVVRAYVNGVQEANTHAVATSMANGAVRIGADLDGTLSNAHQGITLLYKATPTTQQRADLINWLGAYYAVTVTP